ncbi:MAG: fumarylacetoacetate hydrolase family protein, partial [Acidobacteriota bacterium]
MTQTNATHDPELTSWLDAEPATGDAADFPIQNLPFGMYRAAGTEAERVGVRIRNQVIDVWATAEAGVLSSVEEDELLDVATQACAAPTLNALMSLDAEVVSALRRALVAALDARADVAVRERVIHHDLEDVELALPVDIGDYTDFYCSIDHARNVGSLFRPDNPLLPNYKHLPIGYHGRASSVVLSGTPVRRPRGLVKTPDATAPTYRPTARLDYELEVGFFVGAGNAVGAPIAIEDAEGQIFGYCLVNDWSARDVQAFEYQPLGPFLAKSFLTSMSPWIVTTEALAPFRVPARERAAEDPQPAPHLDTESVRSRGGLDLVLDVSLASARMRDEGVEPMRLSRGNFR